MSIPIREKEFTRLAQMSRDVELPYAPPGDDGLWFDQDERRSPIGLCSR